MLLSSLLLVDEIKKCGRSEGRMSAATVPVDSADLADLADQANLADVADAANI